MMPRVAVAIALLLGPTGLDAQYPEAARLYVSGGGGLLASGAYFTGPGSLELDSENAFAGMLQLSVPVHRSVAVVVAGAHGRPDWRITGVPLVGEIGVSGAPPRVAGPAPRAAPALGQPPATPPAAVAPARADPPRHGLHTTVLGDRGGEFATDF